MKNILLLFILIVSIVAGGYYATTKEGLETSNENTNPITVNVSADSSGIPVGNDATQQNQINLSVFGTQNAQDSLLANVTKKLEMVQDLINKINQKIPRDIKDIDIGTVTQIPFEEASNGNAAYIEINKTYVIKPYEKDENGNENPNDAFSRWVINVGLPIGPKGDVGPNGVQGTTGTQGKSGLRGEAGPRGLWGSKNV